MSDIPPGFCGIYHEGQRPQGRIQDIKGGGFLGSSGLTLHS